MMGQTRHTKHSDERRQQRGISNEVIDTLMSHGRLVHHGGEEIAYMTRKELQSAERDIGSLNFRRIVDRLKNTYLVVDGEDIITVGHLTDSKRKILDSKPGRAKKTRRRRTRR